jgi:hypothetical protein
MVNPSLRWGFGATPVVVQELTELWLEWPYHVVTFADFAPKRFAHFLPIRLADFVLE